MTYPRHQYTSATYTIIREDSPLKLDFIVYNISDYKFTLKDETKKSFVKKLLTILRQNENCKLLVYIRKSENDSLYKTSNEEIESQIRGYFAFENIQNKHIQFEIIERESIETSKEENQRSSYRFSEIIKSEFTDKFEERNEFFKPVRMTVIKTFRKPFYDNNEFCVKVKMVSGILCRDDEPKLLCLPSKLNIQIRNIRLDEAQIDFVQPHQTVDLTISFRNKTLFESVSPGSIICDKDYPVPFVSKFFHKI